MENKVIPELKCDKCHKPCDCRISENGVEDGKALCKKCRKGIIAKRGIVLRK